MLFVALLKAEGSSAGNLLEPLCKVAFPHPPNITARIPSIESDNLASTCRIFLLRTFVAEFTSILSRVLVNGQGKSTIYWLKLITWRFELRAF